MNRTRLILVTFLVLGLSSALYFKNFLQPKLAAGLTAKTPDLEPLQVSIGGSSLKKMALGFDSALASLIWIRLLQDAKHTRLPEDKLSWEFSEVDAVTTLDPQFESAYQFGAMYVSFFRRDKEGGKRILEKWVKRRPHYWKPNHMLGMHYFLELNDYQKAAPHILRAAQLPGAPSYISSLGVGLLTQGGAEDYALQSAIELFSAAIHPEAKLRLARRIRGLRWKKQKSHWSEALASYQKSHPGKKPDSLSDLIPFYPKKAERTTASIMESIKVPEELKPLLNETFRFRLSKNKTSVESVNPELEKNFKNLGVFLQEDT